MKTTQDMFDNIIKSTSSYPIISEAMSAALDVLMDNNDEINTSHIDIRLYDENKKHGIKSSETLRGRRARHIIKDYMRELVIASIKEEILKNDDFRIPQNGKNDGLFDDSIISRYEIEDYGNWKEEWDNYASFDIILKGTLKEAFDAHSCENIVFRAIFESSQFSDAVEMTDNLSHRDLFR